MTTETSECSAGEFARSLVRRHTGYSLTFCVGRYAGWWVRLHANSGVFQICLGWFSIAAWNRDIEADVIFPMWARILQAYENEIYAAAPAARGKGDGY